MMRPLSFILVTTALLAACGSDDEGGVAGTGNAPTCNAGEFRLSGELNGEKVEETRSLEGNFVLSQLSKPPALTLGYSGNGSLHLEWPALVANGSTTSVSGKLVRPISGPMSGSTLCVGSGSSLTLLGDDGGKFVFSSLSTGATCPGNPVIGTLAGCYGKR